MTDTYAVFAALSDGTTIRLTLPTEDYNAAVAEWYRLDDLRREGAVATLRGRAVATRSADWQRGGDTTHDVREATTVRHFVVRSMDDRQWNRSAAHMGSLFLLSQRAYAKVDLAGRGHAKHVTGAFAAVGGWVYSKDRHALVQGWFQYATAYAGLALVDGSYRYTVRRFHADWTLGRQGVSA